MDKEIAEKVMGWHIVINDGEHEPFWCNAEEEGAHAVSFWNPEDNLTHAMEVEAEMLSKHNFAIRITRLTPHPELDAPNWVVEFLRHEGTERFHAEENANTLPEAICRAALAAIKEE